MSTTSQVTTFADLYTDLLNRVRVDTTQAATVIQAKRYINNALNDMAMGFEYKMPWLERSATLITHAQYSTGTVSISPGSQTLTGVGTLWNTTNTYAQANARTTGRIVIAGGVDVYNISAVVNDTTITLATKFVADAAVSAGTYKYFEDEYALAADFLRPIDWRSFTDNYNLPIISRAEFRRRFPRPNVNGRPYACCVLDESFVGNTTPVRRVQFYPYPSTAYQIPYTYVTSALAVSALGVESDSLSADTDEPVFPKRYRNAIVLGALAQWYRDKKDDARADAANANYVDMMLRITSDMDIGTHVRAQIVPRAGIYSARGYRGQGGSKRYDINGEFDRMN